MALLNQFQLNDVFRFALGISTDGAEDTYDVMKMSEQGMIRLFALATCIVKSLSIGIKTFHQTRYKQLNKRIGWMVW